MKSIVYNHMSMYNNTEEYINSCISSKAYETNHWAGNGAIADLEGKLRSYYGAKYALCVDSATNGLLYLLLTLGLKRSEIITSALGFGGTIAGALALDCKFHFADVDERLNISPDSVRAILTANHNIKAVIAVDFCGNPHDMTAIDQACEDFGIWHITDAAQSLGATYSTPDICKVNDALVVSFGSGKSVFAGGKGGAIITNNTNLYDRLVSICQHPHRQERDLGIGSSHEFALNGGMHPISAIIARDMFENGLVTVSMIRKKMTDALGVLSSFPSVSSILNQAGSTFYHCPFVVKDNNMFIDEFNASPLHENFYFRKAPFIPLPAQLEVSGLKRKIKLSETPFLDAILDKLYLLHLK